MASKISLQMQCDELNQPKTHIYLHIYYKKGKINSCSIYTIYDNMTI